MHSILKKLEDSITIIFLIHVYTYLVLILIANKTVFDYNKVKLIDVWHIYNTAIFYLRIFLIIISHFDSTNVASFCGCI